MIRAAGILLVDPKGRALFLKRGPGGDNPGEWCFPGGRIEDNEAAIDAAVRETDEESGFKADPAKLELWTRAVANRETTGAAPTPPPGESANMAAIQAMGEMVYGAQPPPGEAIVIPGEQVDFTTYLLRSVEQFVPDIDKSGEHVAYAWAPIGQPPEPLHPGCRVALERFTMDELGIARAIAAGRLTSPQRYMNIWLFSIRITGTATAYRGPKHDPETGKIIREAEFVYRQPENYLTDDFLARCNGLPVIVQHPEKMPMSSEEFSNRIIGTVFVPFIRGDEVWAVAKIFNEQAAAEMEATQISTSPGVILGGDQTQFTMGDGSHVLIEGNPRLVDHICITPLGVWDKGGPASGVDSVDARMDSVRIMRPVPQQKRREPDRLGQALVMICDQNVAHLERSLRR